jgi:hypothetical protein
MDKAAIAGTYSDFKIIRSRKVAQLVVEVPIEQAQALITALGLPNPAEETWVAVARLQKAQEGKEWADYRKEALKQITPPTASPVDLKAHRRFEDLPLPQQAALACQDMEFREWLRESYDGDVLDITSAAEAVRCWCHVDSRSQIQPGTDAGDAWGRLYNRFLLWKSAKAA